MQIGMPGKTTPSGVRVTITPEIAKIVVMHDPDPSIRGGTGVETSAGGFALTELPRTTCLRTIEVLRRRTNSAGYKAAMMGIGKDRRPSVMGAGGATTARFQNDNCKESSSWLC